MSLTWRVTMVVALVVLIGVPLALQRQANGQLRDMIGLLREQNRDVGRLQAEHARLLKAQISVPELESLRADHAAVEQLRGEIESAKVRLQEIERAEPAPAPQK